MAKDRLIFFATDVHGSEVCFRKWLAAAKAYGADTLIMGGDITGKVIVPVLARSSGYVTHWHGQELYLETEGELAAFTREVADAGAYTWHAAPEQVAEVFADDDATEALFARLTAERVRDWVALAEDRLGDDVQAFMIPGNDDAAEVDAELDRGTRLRNAEQRVVWLDDWLPMVSYGDSTPTPWDSPREVSEETYRSRVEALIAQLDDPARAVMNLHVPPHDSQLDMAPALDEERRVRYSAAGDMLMAPVGGHSVREVIERHGPLLGLHGHVHEGRGRSKIGRTVCFNPGSDYQQGILRGVLVRVSPRKGVRDFTFTTG